jgi:deferrochelatase/peroxidase EfeB
LVSRRGFLAGSAIAGSSAAVGLATGATASQVFGETELKTAKTSHEFFGPHQMGIELPIQAVTNFVTLDLKTTTDLAAMKRWMLLLTDDIQRLAKGEPVLAL